MGRILAVPTIVGLLAATLLACEPVAAQSWKSAPEIVVQASGGSTGACADQAARTAFEPALRSIADIEPALASTSASCMAKQAKDYVRLERAKGPARTVGADRCEVTFSVLYRRPELLGAGRACSRLDAPVPVGIVLRGERAPVGDTTLTALQADPALTQQGIGLVSGGLARANFGIVALPQFQRDLLELKTMLGPCALTMERTEQEWTEACRTPLTSYFTARDALARRLADAVAETPALRGWQGCSGLFMAGVVRQTSTTRDVTVQVDVDYYTLAGPVSFVPPYADTRTAPIDLGGEPAAAAQALAQVSEAVIADARQKLARFAHTPECAAPR